MTDHIPESVVQEDRRLSGIAAAATETAAEATMRRDAYRWEQTACPDGPKYGVVEYAKAVGLTHGAISQSVTAWSGYRTVTTCTLDAPHPREQEQPTADQVDTGDKTPEQHAEDRTKARVGDENALIAARLAELGGVKTHTVTNNVNWSDRLRHAQTFVRDGATPEAAAEQAMAAWKREKEREKALRAHIKKRLADAKMPHDKREVDAIIGGVTHPPDMAAVDALLDERIAEHRTIVDEVGRNVKEDAAAQSSHKDADRLTALRDLHDELHDAAQDGNRQAYEAICLAVDLFTTTQMEFAEMYEPRHGEVRNG